MILFSLFMLIFLVGCTAKTYTVNDVHIEQNMIIDLNSQVSLFTLIKDVDGIKPSKKNIKANTFSFHNLSIKYNEFDTSKEGIYTITFTSNDPNRKSFDKTITVADISKPNITLKKNKIYVYNDEVDSINYYQYVSYSDNSKEELTCIIENDEVKNKAGEYEVIVRVYDRANNFAKKKIKVVVKNRPVESISEQQTSENNNSFSSTTNSNTNTSSDNKNNASPSDNANSSSQEKTPVSSNPSQYNKYFSGNSIDSYNSACDYAESIYSSGKVKGYEVMPDGNGFNVIFS